ncbi:MAG: hypothetical protein Q4A32_03405 [Lachnospiraceae bacterium]|nr:hypothetical protein [Lachnospiraceae bacterium]
MADLKQSFKPPIHPVETILRDISCYSELRCSLPQEAPRILFLIWNVVISDIPACRAEPPLAVQAGFFVKSRHCMFR